MKKNTVFQIIIALVIIGVLAVGGITLYRLGYMQGAHAAGPFEFNGRVDPGFRAGDGPDFSFRSGREGISLFRALPGLFILLGFAGMIALGAVLLSRRFLFQRQTPAGQPLPPVEPAPVKEENPENLE